MASSARTTARFALASVALAWTFSAPAGALDNFRCYKVKDKTEPQFAGASVTLNDQFGVNDGTFSVGKPSYVCNSAQVDGSGVEVPNEHLTCYKIKGPTFATNDRPHIETTNPIGTLQLAVKKPRLLCVPSVTAETAGRNACTFGAGALPDETLDPGTARGGDMPIDHLVLVMQENRSFDHYFGRLPAAGHTQVDGLPPNASNPDASNAPVPAFHVTQYCMDDVAHSWNASHLQYDGGLNDGFVVTNNPNGERAMGYLDENDIPFYYGLAKTFAMGDRFFCSLLGPTYPNRFYYLSATSDGRIRNALVPYARESIFDRLDAAGVTYKIYAGQLAFALFFGRSPETIDDYLNDAAAGNLPDVSFIDPEFFGEGQNDEHPPSNPQRGQQFIESIYDALVNSPNWPSSAMMIMYDEHGGFYDHVPPPPACIPDNVPPNLQPGNFSAAFDRYGFRVPFMVISPWAKPGYVSHEVFDHTSVLRFVETRFNLPALTARDANATPITDLFDFSQPHLLNPPALPAAMIDPAQDLICQMFQ